MPRSAFSTSRPTKTCTVCGRTIEWRKKWERDWDNVRCCSAACRRSRNRSDHMRLEAAIVDLLRRRAADATICPSEAARLVAPDAWRPLMEPSRQAARRLAGLGKAEIVQRGRVVDPAAIRGPIRIRLTAAGRRGKD